jgi:hypothetical protein
MGADDNSHAEVRAMKVTVESKIAGTQLERFHQLYRSAFEPLLTLTAVRQVLTEDEFEAQMTDERVDKLVAWDDDEPIGMMTVTRELETVPWISPEFFRARYPDHAARNAIFYVAFALADPDRREAMSMAAMTEVLAAMLIESGGVCGYDVCAYNRDVRRFADNVNRFFKRQGPAVVDTIDTETYYAADFGAALDPATRSGRG